jgi:hypothetical protein
VAFRAFFGVTSWVVEAAYQDVAVVAAVAIVGLEQDSFQACSVWEIDDSISGAACGSGDAHVFVAPFTDCHSHLLSGLPLVAISRRPEFIDHESFERSESVLGELPFAFISVDDFVDSDDFSCRQDHIPNPPGFVVWIDGH